MTTKQQPIGSGFGAQTTAAEVLEGIDLSGKRAIVTGGYSGLGLETTRALVAKGADVVVPARRPDQARQELDGLSNVTVDELDLADLDSVTAFADRQLADGTPIDFVINSAAVMASPETRVGPHDWEQQFATNHLGHFALVNRLWPLLAGNPNGARVISVSSRGHKNSGIRFDDLMFEQPGSYDKWVAYGQAKTANALFAVELDRRGQDQGVRAFSLHPGGILTPLQRHLPKQEMVDRGWIHEDGTQKAKFKTPEQGAATQTWAATSPQLDGMGGVYLEDCDIAYRTDEAPKPEAQGVDAHATDPDAARRLWEVSAELTGVDALAVTQT
jgi:NAD(P)-dependent dehydrogenase (short-subunit alcohol dehydrogenase family)